jgi:plasmid stabilization system protein ParE
MKFRIRILWRAERDIDQILTWLGERSAQGANSWKIALKNALTTLASSADSFGHAPENEDQELDVRQMMFRTSKGRNYRLLYTIEDAMVYVMHVRSPGQDLVPPDELQKP